MRSHFFFTMKVTIKLVDNKKGVSWLPIREAN